MLFRHILTKFHTMYPWGSKILVILLERGKKKLYQIYDFFYFYLYVHLLIAILCFDTIFLLDTVKQMKINYFTQINVFSKNYDAMVENGPLMNSHYHHYFFG